MAKLNPGDIVLLLGPTGAGKSLQAERLAKKYGWQWISIGQLLRHSANPDIKAQQETGGLIDNNLVNQTVATALESLEPDSVVILDGYPRHTEQADWLDDFLSNSPRKLVQVVLIMLSRAESERRLAARGRHDDLKSAIARKWRVFDEEVTGVVEHYRTQDKLLEVDGEATPEVVTKRIEAALGLA